MALFGEVIMIKDIYRFFKWSIVMIPTLIFIVAPLIFLELLGSLMIFVGQSLSDIGGMKSPKWFKKLQAWIYK